MATHTRLYLSSDTGAPALGNTVGALNNVMKTCLVGSGGIAYGSVPAAGWTNEYEDAGAYKLVLRNSPAEGTGYFLRLLDDGTGTSATAAMAHVQGYSSMSDIDTGNDATPPAVAGWPGARIEKGSGSNLPWALIADERTAILCTNYTATNGTAVVYYFGDYISYIPGFGYAWITAAGGASVAATDRSSYLCTASGQNAASGNINLMRGYSGDPGNSKLALVSPHGAASSPGTNQPPNVSVSSVLGNSVITHPILIASNIGPIGELRGLRYPSQNMNGINAGTVLAGTKVGSSLMALRCAVSYNSSFAQFSGGLFVETSLPWQ